MPPAAKPQASRYDNAGVDRQTYEEPCCGNSRPHDPHMHQPMASLVLNCCGKAPETEVTTVKPKTEYLTVTVTVKTTPSQQRDYAAEYGLGSDAEPPEQAARADLRDRLSNEVNGALYSSYALREFTSYSVSEVTLCRPPLSRPPRRSATSGSRR